MSFLQSATYQLTFQYADDLLPDLGTLLVTSLNIARNIFFGLSNCLAAKDSRECFGQIVLRNRHVVSNCLGRLGFDQATGDNEQMVRKPKTAVDTRPKTSR
jgi:hypothetical protein